MISTVSCRDSVRAPGPGDAAALVAMFERSSSESRYARFLSPVPRFPRGHLADVVHAAPGRWSRIAVDDCSGRVVALGSVFRTGARTGELGLLVEDAEQHRGLGTELLAVLVTRARESGIHTLEATTLAQSLHVRHMLARHGEVQVTCTGPSCDLRVDLAHRFAEPPTLAPWRARPSEGRQRRRAR
jgi:GNAT superfamily N-acetyltransferase